MMYMRINYINMQYTMIYHEIMIIRNVFDYFVIRYIKDIAPEFLFIKEHS